MVIVHTIKGDTYKERSFHQVKLWSEGFSVHNDVDGECCPDFSCCNKKMNTPIKERVKYFETLKKSGSDACDLMLFGFLVKSLTTAGVHPVPVVLVGK